MFHSSRTPLTDQDHRPDQGGKGKSCPLAISSKLFSGVLQQWSRIPPVFLPSFRRGARLFLPKFIRFARISSELYLPFASENSADSKRKTQLSQSGIKILNVSKLVCGGTGYQPRGPPHRTGSGFWNLSRPTGSPTDPGTHEWIPASGWH